MSIANFTDVSSHNVSVDQEASLQKVYQLRIEEYKNGNSYLHLISYLLMTLGVFGNALCLLILFRSEHMRTAHFIYYRVLAISELIYCLNFFVSEIVIMQFQVSENDLPPNMKLAFTNQLTATYFANIRRFVYSSTGYVVLYTTSFISVDRTLAVYATMWYSRVPNVYKWRMACYSSLVAIVLSGALNSWAGITELQVHTVNVPINQTVYQIRSTPRDGTYKTALKVKDVYNLIFRIIYPFILLTSTSMVILGYIRQRRRRSSLRSNQSATTMMREQREQISQRALFYLMISVVLLAFVQVIPREVKRVLGLLYPLRQCQATFKDQTESFDVRMESISLMSAHAWLGVASNIAVMMDRSLSFYLYFFLNRIFRTEILLLICPKRISSHFTLRSQFEVMTAKFSQISIASGFRSISQRRHRRYSSRRPRSNYRMRNEPRQPLRLTSSFRHTDPSNKDSYGNNSLGLSSINSRVSSVRYLSPNDAFHNDEVSYFLRCAENDDCSLSKSEDVL